MKKTKVPKLIKETLIDSNLLHTDFQVENIAVYVISIFFSNYVEKKYFFEFLKINHKPFNQWMI